jgi:hypothetical protein
MRHLAKNMAVQRIQIALIAATVSFAGCGMLSRMPDKNIVNKFDDVTSLRIPNKGHPIEITDPSSIRRLKTIYATARWKPFWDTMPNDVVTIKCMQNDEELFQLLYGATWLIEWHDDQRGRKAILDETSHEWLDELVQRRNREARDRRYQDYLDSEMDE